MDNTTPNTAAQYEVRTKTNADDQIQSKPIILASSINKDQVPAQYNVGTNKKHSAVHNANVQEHGVKDRKNDPLYTSPI